MIVSTVLDHVHFCWMAHGVKLPPCTLACDPEVVPHGNAEAFWLGCLRYNPEQIDAQQAVGEPCALHFDVVVQAERQPECALCDPLMQVGNAFTVFTFAAGDSQHAFFHLDVQVVLHQASGRDDDALAVIPVFLDVIA